MTLERPLCTRRQHDHRGPVQRRSDRGQPATPGLHQPAIACRHSAGGSTLDVWNRPLLPTSLFILFFPPLLNHSLLASVFYLLCCFFPSRLTSVAPPAHGTGHLTCLTVIRFDRKQSPISEEIPPIHISPTAAISSSYLAPRLNTTGPSVRVDYLFSLLLLLPSDLLVYLQNIYIREGFTF